jgi:hypothetical protein
MCSKRVFTKNDLDINYHDYNTIKNGSEILKTIKSENKNAILNKFKNFNSWQTISSAYFKYINNDELELTYLKNIYNSNESFTYELCEPIIDLCASEKNTLYPYGKIITKRVTNPSFPSNLYLCRWCNNKDVLNENDFKDIKKYDCVEKVDVKKSYINKIDTCLEQSKNNKKPRPLFI